MPVIDPEFLNHIASEVVAGLIGIALTIGVERTAKFIERRRLEKRFPIAGTYLSRYEDKGVSTTAPVTLKQSGSKITGYAVEKNRKWIFEGQVTEDGYFQGRYWAENVFDKGFGSFLLKIDRNCDMDGYWFGKDAKENEIQQGPYHFLKNTVAIAPVQENEIPALLNIAEQQLGDAYINRDDLDRPKDGIALSARIGDRVVGFGTAKIVDSRAFYSKFEPFFTQDPTKLRSLDRRLPREGKVGLVASVAVLAGYTGRGVGSMLVARCIQELRNKGVSVLVATAWHSTKGINAESIMHNEGFQRILDVPDFWRDDSIRNNYSCPVCGAPPCVCSAAVYVRSL